MDSLKESEDLSGFRSHVVQCLRDERVVGYFQRRLVDSRIVVQALCDGKAFQYARSTDAYLAYDHVRAERIQTRYDLDVIIKEAVSIKSGPIASALVPAALLLLLEAFRDDGVWRLLAILAGSIAAYSSGYLFSTSHGWRRARVMPVLVFGICLMTIPHYFLHLMWDPSVSGIWFVLSLAAGILLSDPSTFQDFVMVLRIPLLGVNILSSHIQEEKLRRLWLDDTTDGIVVPCISLMINTLLGEDQNKLLVEQHSKGLRKLHDPGLTVSTRSEQRVRRTLSRFDGGSIALSGSRGVGKSTLLRTFCDSPGTNRRSPELSVYISAPAEYVPRDFLIELFQRVCEAYLDYKGYPYEGPLRRIFFSRKRGTQILRDVSSATLRSIIALTLLSLLVWSVITDVRPTVIDIDHTYIRRWFASVTIWWHNWWLHHRLLSQILGAVLFMMIWPGRRRWRYLRWQREPLLVVKARENLYRLQVEQTTTWALNAGLPGARGGSLSLSKGASVKHVPWTLPELVGRIRRFLAEVAQVEMKQGRRVLIGIDEIDRIGTPDQAARFVGEVKAIFGIENCFFLVSVAEDVGSTFARRAVSERSVFENAFDDVVVVEPLTLEESRDLLLKRVPGFTDAFVCLAHSLSGGVSRELIRVTRRLIELNSELRNELDYHPRLQDLTISIVKEGLVEALIGTRNVMAQLTLDARWGPAFDLTRNMLDVMRAEPRAEVVKSKPLIMWLADIQSVYWSPGELEVDIKEPGEGDDSDPGQLARRSLLELSALAFFGMTVVSAFADESFDFEGIKNKIVSNDAGSYEQLAAARRELAFSPHSCRVTLERFREAKSL